jgi:hypothetical protein
MILRLRLVLVFLIIIFVIFFHSSSIEQSQQRVQAEENSTKTNGHVNIPTILSDKLILSDFNFSINLPMGWKGLNHGYVVLASPGGIIENNGNLKGKENNTLMVVEVLNHSDYKNSKNDEQIQNNGCKYLSEKSLSINGLHTKEILINCGSRGDEKIINYVFGSNNKIIIVGLKGTVSSFNTYLEDFKNSIKSVNMDNSTGTRQSDPILR